MGGRKQARVAVASPFHEVDLDLFKARFRFLRGTEAGFVALANDALPAEPRVRPHNAMGRCIVERVEGRLQCWIWLNIDHQPQFTSAQWIGVIAHESLHAVRGMLEACGCNLSTMDDEVLCYCLEWVSREAAEFYGVRP